VSNAERNRCVYWSHVAAKNRFHPRGGACFLVASLIVDPSSPATLYATGEIATSCCSSGTFECSSFKSLDGGVTWACLGIDLLRIVAAPSSPATLYGLGPAGCCSPSIP